MTEFKLTIGPVQEVWIVSNKTSSVFFATEEIANQYVSAFAPAISGGMSIQCASILGTPPAPDGFKRVPKLPSPDQLRAAMKYISDPELAKTIYMAMIAEA